MGLLQLAGAVGGFGTGAGRGLEQMNQGIITSGLQQDERKFAEEKLQQQLAHAEKLQTINEAGATKRAQATIESHEKIEGWKSMVEEGKHLDTVGLEKEKLGIEGRKVDIAEQAEISKDAYYNAYAGYLTRATKAGSASPMKDLSETSKAALGFYNNRIIALEKERNLVTTPPDKVLEIDKQIVDLSNKGLGLLGMGEKPIVYPGERALSPAGKGEATPTAGETAKPIELPSSPRMPQEEQSVVRSRPGTLSRGTHTPAEIAQNDAANLSYDLQMAEEKLATQGPHLTAVGKRALEEEVATLQQKLKQSQSLINRPR